MCANGSKNDEIPADIPLVSRLWLKAYKTVPPVNLPIVNLSFSFCIVSALFLIAVRIVVQNMFFINVFGWPEDEAGIGGGNFAAITHSTILCTGLITAFWNRSYSPSEPMSKAPLWWREQVDALLQFCTGYMLYDGLFLLKNHGFNPLDLGDDLLFCVHHIMTTVYMTQARVYGAGHMSAMMCMLLGELSNPLHNTFMALEQALELDCCNGESTKLAFFHVSTVFSVVYVGLRMFIGPIICAHMSYDLLCSKHAKEHLPIALRLFWNVMIWGVIFGSVPWVMHCLEMLQTNVLGKVEGDGEL